MTSESLQHCSVLLVSSDMEWNHAYLSALKRLFVVDEQTCEQAWQVEEMVNKKRPDFMVVMIDQPGVMKELRHVVERQKPAIPIIAVADEGADELIKAGVTFCVRPVDLLSAVKYSGLVLREQERKQAFSQAENSAETLRQLNNALYRDAPDPVCYVQDGLFMDANPAFLKAFDIADADTLHDLTLLSLATPRSEKTLRALLKTITEKGLSTAESVDMETTQGEKKQFICTASQVNYKGEPAIQLHWRGGGTGGGSVSVDKTTGLMGYGALQQALDNDREQKKDQSELGVWAYLWVENYRDVWSQDGYPAAEILMKSVADGVERYMPASTIAVRFCDDALILYIQGTLNASIDKVEALIGHVQDQVPENIGRMIHPSLYAALEVIEHNTQDETLLSTSFRAAKNLSLAQGQGRVAAGGGGKISRNDERRLNVLQKTLDDGRILVKYQPISHLATDGVQRFAICLDMLPDPEGEEDIELSSLLSVAERHGRAQVLDELKLNTFLRDVLSYDGDQQSITGYIGIGSQSLQDPKFPEWVLSQLNQTGLAVEQLVFEITLDSAINAFSGALKFSEIMHQKGGKTALTEVGRFDDEVTELLSRLKPDVIKLDMREIDTFEDDEEERFMSALKAYAEEHKQTIIVDHMESPAQLSRVWPYDLQLLQGDGMVPPMETFNYDFSEPLF